MNGRTVFLLNDSFITPDAAPVTSPRTCEPGPGSLVLVQADGAMNISSSRLNFLPQSSPMWGDQGFRDPTMRTRTAGRRFIASLSLAEVRFDARGFLSWLRNEGVAVADIASFGLLFTGDGEAIAIQPVAADGRTRFGTIATLSDDTVYQIMPVQRSNGYYFYIRGGAFSVWTLLDVYRTGAQDVCFGWSNHSQRGSVGELLIPDNLWVPRPLVADSLRARDVNRNYTLRGANNPIIHHSNIPDPNEKEQYVPAPVRVPNNDIWIYVKGTNTIYGWKSVDDGETFTPQNDGRPVIDKGPIGSWEARAVRDPAAVHDANNGLIHLYYKGCLNDIESEWSIGHATAPDANPASMTKDPGNPILTREMLQAQLGLAATPTDLALSDVIMIGDTFFFYGVFQDSGDHRRFKLWYGTGPTWNSITAKGIILWPSMAELGGDLLYAPSVFRWPGTSSYIMIFDYGVDNHKRPNSRRLRVATSENGIDWTVCSSQVLRPEDGLGWERNWVYGASILKSSTPPFVDPIEIAGRYLLYYSGHDGNTAETGLAFLQDSAANTVERTFPVRTLGPSDGLGDPDSSGDGGTACTVLSGAWEFIGDGLTSYGPPPNTAGGAWVATYDAGRADIVIEAVVNTGPASVNTVGVVVRFVDNYNFWSVVLSVDGNDFRITEHKGGTFFDRAKASVAVAPDTEHRLTVIVQGDSIQARVNDSTTIVHAPALLNRLATRHGVYAATPRTRIQSFVMHAREPDERIPN